MIGFDDIVFAALTERPLTTVALPREEIGRAAVEALLNAIKEPNHLGQEYKITPKLIVRESTGRVQTKKTRSAK